MAVGRKLRSPDSQTLNFTVRPAVTCSYPPTTKLQPASWNLRLPNNTIQQGGIILMCVSRTLGHTPRDKPSAECHWERSARMFLLHILEGWSVSNYWILCSAPLTLTNWYCTGHNVIRWLKHKSTQLPTSFHTKSPQVLLQQVQNWEKLWVQRQYGPRTINHRPPPLTRNSHPGGDQK